MTHKASPLPFCNIFLDGKEIKVTQQKTIKCADALEREGIAQVQRFLVNCNMPFSASMWAFTGHYRTQETVPG